MLCNNFYFYQDIAHSLSEISLQLWHYFVVGCIIHVLIVGVASYNEGCGLI